MEPVELVHFAPIDEQVDLGREDQDDRADGDHRSEERHLGLGELLRGIGEEKHGVSQRQGRHREGAVYGAETADARCVDQGQAPFEQWRR